MKTEQTSIRIVSLLMAVFLGLNVMAQADSTYLKDIRNELRIKWPNNRTINIVFHGHSVPSGYYTGGVVHKLNAYPHLSMAQIKKEYPYAVINSITTSIGGEQAERGETRFENEVLTMRPDVLFIDYALNDRGIGLERAKIAWQKMIDAALDHSFTDRDGNVHKVKVYLMTPTPDTNEDISSDESPLALHAAQIRQLAIENNVGLIDSYAIFKEIASRESLSSYMAQSNHINGKGHQVVADEIAKLFIQEDVIADGLYYIKGNYTGRFMTVEEGSTVNNTKIIVEDSTGTVNQKFWIKKTAEGYAISSLKSNLALGMFESSSENGANLVQLDSTGELNQRFSFTSASGEGFYWIVNKNSYKNIATPGNENTNGTPVIQWAFYNNLNYQWRFIPAEDLTSGIESSIENNNNFGIIELFPNPSNGQLSIIKADNKPMGLEVLSYDGKLSYDYMLINKYTDISLPTSMTPGMYFFKFNNAQASIVKEVLIQ